MGLNTVLKCKVLNFKHATQKVINQGYCGKTEINLD